MGILETIGIVTTRATLAFLVFTLGVVAASLGKRLVKKSLQKIKINQTLALLDYPYDCENLAATATFYLIYITSIAITFWLLGIVSAVMWLLVFAFVMALTFTVLSFAKDFLPNLMGWVIATQKLKLRAGSKINLRKVTGKVQKVRFVDTIVISPTGDELHVPNVLFWRMHHL